MARCCTFARRSRNGRGSAASRSHSGASASRTPVAAYACSSVFLAEASSAAPSASSSAASRPRGVVPGQDERADLGAFPADEQLGGGADHAAARERVTVRVAVGQPVQQRAHVERLRRGGVEVPGQYRLAQPSGPDARDRGRDRPLPLRRGQAAVVPAHRAGCGHRHGRAGISGPADGGEPGPAVPAAEHDPGQHQDGSVGGRIEGEAAERHRARSGHLDLVLGAGPLEHRAEPLLRDGEPVLAGGQRDPGRLAPADQALAAPHPGQRVGLGQPADQFAWILDSGGADQQPPGVRGVFSVGLHASQPYVRACTGASPCPGLWPAPVPGRGAGVTAAREGHDQISSTRGTPCGSVRAYYI